MNTEKIQLALQSALSLLTNELGCIELDELKSDYIRVIEQLESALQEINQHE